MLERECAFEFRAFTHRDRVLHLFGDVSGHVLVDVGEQRFERGRRECLGFAHGGSDLVLDFLGPRVGVGCRNDSLRLEINARVRLFVRSFEKVVGAQVAISTINTILTAAFLHAAGFHFKTFLIPTVASWRDTVSPEVTIAMLLITLPTIGTSPQTKVVRIRKVLKWKPAA